MATALRESDGQHHRPALLPDQRKRTRRLHGGPEEHAHLSRPAEIPFHLASCPQRNCASDGQDGGQNSSPYQLALLSMQYLKDAWVWLVFSSADPQRVSLFVKSVLMGVLV